MHLGISAVIRSSIIFVISWFMSTAYAATPVFVDPSGVCATNTPCFTTIQEAVNNAGPAPATVSIYPGTYNESVNIGLMGSAISGLLGTITLESVSGGVTVDGGVAGPAFFLMATTLNGNITFDDLSVTSTDFSGINLSNSFGFGGSVNGNFTLTDVTANNSGLGGDGDGVAVEITGAGNVTLTNVTANGNASDGMDIDFVAGVTGTITVTNTTTTNNGDDGLDIDAGMANVSIIIRDSTSNSNDGQALFGC